jgi:hypothetical protein
MSPKTTNMKRQIITVVSKYSGALFLSAGLFLSASAGIPPGNEHPAEVKFLGSSEDAVLFDVLYDNPGGKKFSVIVLDEDGNLLFEDVYKDRKFDKKFKLPKADNARLTFVIRDYRDKDLKQTFQINTHIKEEVVVTKL